VGLTVNNPSRSSRSQPTVAGKFVVSIFFLFFLGMGAIFLFLILRDTVTRLRTYSWKPTDCEIVASSGVDLPKHYALEIQYDYDFGGQRYRGTNYTVGKFTSSDYSKVARIVDTYPSGTKATCFVNPSRPSDAVLRRGSLAMVPFLLLPLLFIFIGGGGIYITWRGPKLLPGNDGAPPWMCRQDWASGRIVSSSKPAMIGAWIFSGLWNLISLPFAVALLDDWMRSGDGHLLIGFIFPAVGLALLVWAGRLTTRWRRFGDSVFEMTSVPGVVGGALEGTIRLSQPLRAVDGFQVTLTCMNRVTTGAGKNRSTVERVLWTEDQRVDAGTGDKVPVAFYVPPDCRESNSDDTDNVVIWRLKATAKEAGVGYASKFEVPMFKVAQTPQQVAAAKTILSRERAEVEHYQPSANSRIRLQSAAGSGQEFYFPAMRNAGAGLGLMVFFAFWSAVFWLLVHGKAPLLFPIFWGFSDLLIFAAVLHFLTGTTRVVANATGLTITKRMLCFGRTWTVSAGVVADIKAVIGMTSGQSAYQNITVVCRDGRKITAGSAIRNSQEAQWLAAQMLKCVRGQR
jgi:hypothetical protein